MLLHENLARARAQARTEDARRAHRLTALLAARKAARLRASADRRARLASDAALYAALSTTG